MKICPSCSKENIPDARYCTYCGEELDAGSLIVTDQTRPCPYCAEEIEFNADICKYCDRRVSITDSKDDDFIQCSHCHKLIRKNATVCRYCGSATRTKQPSDEPSQSLFSKIRTYGARVILPIAIVAVGLFFIPLMFPDISSTLPGEILLLGVSFLVVGLIAWALVWFGNIEFTGRGGCCYFFPLIGILIVIYGLIKLFFP